MLKIIAKNSKVWIENIGEDEIHNIEILYKNISFENNKISDLKSIKYDWLLNKDWLVYLPFETRYYFSYIINYQYLWDNKIHTVSGNYMWCSEIMNIGDKYLEYNSPIDKKEYFNLIKK